MKTTCGLDTISKNTCGFHLGFHWVSKLMHVTNLAIFIGYQTYELLMSLRNITSISLWHFWENLTVTMPHVYCSAPS